jgi:hypothetical protein
LYPNPILRSLDLIDTPGLFSSYEVDSENASSFLRIHGSEMNRATEAQVSNADAILYLFSHSSLSDSDRTVMEKLQGAALGRTTPLNAIAVLTQADTYDDPQPLIAAQRITQRLMSDHPKLHNLFYKIQPIAGLLALGAQTLTSTDFTILQKLACLPEETLTRLLRSADRFQNREVDDPTVPSTADRRQIFGRLDKYGIELSCDLIRQGVKDLSILSERLLDSSGVPELRQLIVTHFGGRAYLIKFNRSLQSIKQLLFAANSKQIDQEQAAVQKIRNWLDELECDELFFQNLRELKVLSDLYDHQNSTQLQLDATEIQQVLEITGEKGVSCAQRLGLEPTATLEQMEALLQPRLCHWRSRSADPGNNPETIRAAIIVAQSLDRLPFTISSEASAVRRGSKRSNFIAAGLDRM